jgi:hypothetical protein
LDDYINVKVGINVEYPGMYTLMGSLKDDDGAEITATNRSHLNIGAQSIFLSFYGSKAKGQRRLENLTLYDDGGSIMDHLDLFYVTRAYDNMEQEVPLARLTGEYNDQGIDVDGDGFYDFLSVEVSMDTESPGEYSLTGNLYSPQGEEIVWSIAHKNLSSGHQKMILDFDGKSIWGRGIDGPYTIKDLVLSGRNWTVSDMPLKDYITSAYNASQFEDPVYPEKVISGSGSGELLLTISIRETLPVFTGRYSQDIVGISIPPISTPFQVNGSKSGYAYNTEGLYMPGKPNDFTVTADGVKNLNIGLRKEPAKNGTNATRTWVTTQIDAEDGRAVADTDLISPGSYHVKIFGDAADNVSEVNLVLTVVKDILVDGKFGRVPG